MCRVPDCPEVPNERYLVSTRFSNSTFSETTALISSIKISIESFTFLEEHSNKKSLILILASELAESQTSEKCN